MEVSVGCDSWENMKRQTGIWGDLGIYRMDSHLVWVRHVIKKV